MTPGISCKYSIRTEYITKSEFQWEFHIFQLSQSFMASILWKDWVHEIDSDEDCYDMYSIPTICIEYSIQR